MKLIRKIKKPSLNFKGNMNIMTESDKSNSSDKSFKSIQSRYKIPFESKLIPRFYFFFEILIILLLNFGFYFIFSTLIPYSHVSSDDISLIVFWAENLASVILATIVGLIIIKKLFQNKETIPNPKNKAPLNEVFSTFKISKRNIVPQIIYSFLLLFLIFIPLDFAAYCIPGIMNFSVETLLVNGSSSVSRYLTFTQFSLFITYSIVISLFVGIREELYFRGFAVTRARRYIGNYSAVILISLYFGLEHFVYIIPGQSFTPNLFPAFIWGLSAFIVGIASALFIMKKRFIIPLIFAHTANNIISSTALWMFANRGYMFIDIAKLLYLPLLIVSLILLVVFHKKVISGLKSFGKMFPEYLKESGKSHRERATSIFLDVIFGIILLFVGMLLF